MRNYKDEDDDHDYSPNELANLAINHREKYLSIVNQNLREDDTVERWESRNLERAKEDLAHQRSRK